jgi:hypothetical protein
MGGSSTNRAPKKPTTAPAIVPGQRSTLRRREVETSGTTIDADDRNAGFRVVAGPQCEIGHEAGDGRDEARARQIVLGERELRLGDARFGARRGDVPRIDAQSRFDACDRI